MLPNFTPLFLFVDFCGFRAHQVLGGSRPGGREYPERVGQPVCQVFILVVQLNIKFLVSCLEWDDVGQCALMKFFESVGWRRVFILTKMRCNWLIHVLE